MCLVCCLLVSGAVAVWYLVLLCGAVTLYFGHLGAFYGFMVYSGLNGCMWLNGAYTLSSDVSRCRHGVGCGVWCCLVWLSGLLCGSSGSSGAVGGVWSGCGGSGCLWVFWCALVVCCLWCCLWLWFWWCGVVSGGAVVLVFWSGSVVLVWVQDTHKKKDVPHHVYTSPYVCYLLSKC